MEQMRKADVGLHPQTLDGQDECLDLFGDHRTVAVVRSRQSPVLLRHADAEDSELGRALPESSRRLECRTAERNSSCTGEKTARVCALLTYRKSIQCPCGVHPMANGSSIVAIGPLVMS